jgi:hypothetical protein
MFPLSTLEDLASYANPLFRHPRGSRNRPDCVIDVLYITQEDGFYDLQNHNQERLEA